MIRRLDPGERVAGSLAGQRLGVVAVVFIVASALAPLTVVAGTFPTAIAVTGNLALPAAFVAVGLLVGVFSIGYVTMSHHLPHAGALYAYVSHGLSRVWGVAAAWVSLLAYDLVQVSLYGAIGAAVSPLVVQAWAVTFPWWVYALAAWGVVGLLGVLRVEVNGRVLACLLVAEVALIIVYDVTFLTHPAHGYAASTWSLSALAGPGAGAVLAISLLGYTGFESAVVFAEEARHPRRTIPAATYLAVAGIAVLYGVSSWAMVVGTGTGEITKAARGQGTELVFTLAASLLGAPAGTWGHALFATSILAAMVSFHATTARYVFALGREGVLPSVFGRTSASGSPRAGSLAQSGIGLGVIVGFAVAGADPVVNLFYTASTSGAVGVLVLLVAAGMAVIGFFARDRRGESFWPTVAAPLVSMVGLGMVLVVVVANIATLLGVDASSPLRWGVPAGFAVTALAGAGYGLTLKLHRPHVYAAIGHGAKAPLTRAGNSSTITPSPGGGAPLLPRAVAEAVASAEAWTNGQPR